MTEKYHRWSTIYQVKINYMVVAPQLTYILKSIDMYPKTAIFFNLNKKPVLKTFIWSWLLLHSSQCQDTALHVCGQELQGGVSSYSTSKTALWKESTGMLSGSLIDTLHGVGYGKANDKYIADWLQCRSSWTGSLWGLALPSGSLSWFPHVLFIEKLLALRISCISSYS